MKKQCSIIFAISFISFNFQENASQLLNNPWTNSSTTPWPALNGRNNNDNVNYNLQPTWVTRPLTTKAPNNYRHDNKPSIVKFISNERNEPLAFSHNAQVTTSRSFEVTRRAKVPINSSSAKNNEDRLKEDQELREFSENLLLKDTSNLFKLVQADYQGKTRSGSLQDQAPEPLLKVQDGVRSNPTVKKLSSLYDNYILQSDQNEISNSQEHLEENDFLDSVLATNVMQFARNFLVKKEKISKDPQKFKELLRRIWFNMYSRGGGKIGSSAFEHVFLTEIKNNSVSGLHNWIYFAKEERRNSANYLGYLKVLDFDKGSILKHHFNFNNIDKPVGTMFIGTSPELEMALYSTCFVMRADDTCPLRLAGKNFIIRTYTYRYRGKSMIGSAFPEI